MVALENKVVNAACFNIEVITIDVYPRLDPIIIVFLTFCLNLYYRDYKCGEICSFTDKEQYKNTSSIKISS